VGSLKSGGEGVGGGGGGVGRGKENHFKKKKGFSGGKSWGEIDPSKNLPVKGGPGKGEDRLRGGKKNRHEKRIKFLGGGGGSVWGVEGCDSENTKRGSNCFKGVCGGGGL